MDADAFSYPIGYVPQFPAPPKYIKVRSHGRKERDFNRVFLAQELKGRSGVEIAQSGGRSLGTATTRPGGNRKDGNAIWAMEFSKDGKYLAAGGKDFAVRVWAVLSSKEDRQSHELDDDNVNKEGESVRLNAPVFKPKTVQEYSGHTASVLDLSWSKVRQSLALQISPDHVLEQLFTLLVHGQDRAVMACESRRVSLLLQTQ